MANPDPLRESTVEPERFTLDALAALAGVTPRTVRYYIAERLLDRPVGEKRGAHYVRRHLEQLVQIRRWSEAGLGLERIRALLSGAPEDPAPRSARAGAVEVWSRITVVDGLEVHLEPGRAGLSPEQARRFVSGIAGLYRAIRTGDDGTMIDKNPAVAPGTTRKKR